MDFGSPAVTGIHVLIVEKLRDYYGLEKRPVKVIEPYQMLGEIDSELIKAMDIDVIGLFSAKNMFGVPNENWKVHKTLWGQEVMFPGDFNYTYNSNGDILMYPEGDTSDPPSGMMPKTGYFFDALDRQKPIDDSTLKVEDNLEEFALITEPELAYWKNQTDLRCGQYKSCCCIARRHSPWRYCTCSGNQAERSQRYKGRGRVVYIHTYKRGFH